MRDDAARVADIIDACRQIEEHIAPDRSAFEADPVRQAAAQRWLEIVGEAATRLSDEFRDARPEVPWREIIGMRTILAHGYFTIDIDVIWRSVTVDIPTLRGQLET
ncbi:MAG TPA: DUF86 domain-containing protein [Iamia sp.]|nr:DUF86 domain-containing protein [Iamia sp.]